GLERLVRRRRDGVVERRGGAVGPDLRVGMPLVVDHLVLVRDRPAAILGDEILDAAVAAGRDLPLEAEIEVVEGVDGDDVAAALRVLTAAGLVDQPAILHDPAGRRKRRFLEAAPAGGRLTVEQRALARGLRSESGGCRDEEE